MTETLCSRQWKTVVDILPILKGEDLLAYEPEVGFSAGLEQTIPYYR
ncbi:dTDP-glucose 4,6-dehydratase [Halobacterium salinarum]|nr:dTDP-glucose 4,6-dehydratase [Halobacterium salinarum]MBB6091083.1 hypothetical protein [Halobacterium salinarum]MDL0126227.1 dTDP-glucose 4,6-dehydratase [Halobacterium salinarum]UEB92122.1 dTDP-glucose 4,6-dehydratase [Halobacterium salinarum NRC-34001]